MYPGLLLLKRSIARRWRFVLAVLAAIFSGCANQSAIVLSPSRPAGSSTLTIAAPGQGRHAYTLQSIDTTAFARGGTIDIEVAVAADSGTDGSFDLFPPDAAIPTEGRSTISLATAYDVPKGQTRDLHYTFTRGQIFRFGGEGNWFSPPGSVGKAELKVTVR